VADAESQIVSNEVIASERETAYLLKSETMKNRLLAAAQRQNGLSLDAVTEKLGI
jgi:antitoxin YefM